MWLLLDRDVAAQHLECAPGGGHGSGGWFDRLPGVLVLELLQAQVADGRVKPSAVTDLVDEAGKVRGDIGEALIEPAGEAAPEVEAQSQPCQFDRCAPRSPIAGPAVRSTGARKD